MSIGLASGCSRSDAEAHVAAKNIGDLQVWRSNAGNRFNAAAWKEFDLALQEIRWRASSEGKSGAAVNAALCAQIDGHTFDEVLRLGYEARLARLEAMRAEMQRMVDGNALLVPKAGDADAAASLERMRQRQQARLQTVLTDMAETRTRLVALGGTPAAAENEAPKEPAQAAPTTLSRQAALDEINQMIETRRTRAKIAYGDWPVRVDASGLLIKGADQDVFSAKQAAAAANGHTVIPVRIKDRWFIFDQAVDVPSFSSAVTANLTEADRKEITRRWANLEAEIWARDQARYVEPPTKASK